LTTPLKVDDAINHRALYVFPVRLSTIYQELVVAMAHLNIAIDHGQTPEAAREHFQRAVTAAESQFRMWIHRAEWSVDRTQVTLHGTGYEVALSYDDQKVYARGTVPLAFKLLEAPVKAFIKKTLTHEP